MERKNPFFGAVSLLVIFVVLFLTVLALLTVERVNTGKTASVRRAEQTVRQFGAYVRAEEILAALRSGERPPEVTEEDGVFRYACEISPTQWWDYRITFENDGTYAVDRRLVSDVPAPTEPPADVWDGNSDIGETP